MQKGTKETHLANIMWQVDSELDHLKNELVRFGLLTYDAHIFLSTKLNECSLELCNKISKNMFVLKICF